MNRDRILNDLATIVAFETTADKLEEIEKCIAWLDSEFLSLAEGLNRHEGKVSGYPYLYYEHPEPRLLWLAHVDVVPGSPEQFGLVTEGGLAYGRGVKDMKGGAMAFLTAFRELCQAGRTPPVNILLTSDEEVAGPTVANLVGTSVIKGPIALTPDNGSIDQIVVQQKGVIWARLIAVGEGGHGASPWNADNPNTKLLVAIKLLREQFPLGEESDWRVTLEMTRFYGQDTRCDSQVSTKAACGIDIRFPPGMCADQIIESLRLLLPADCQLDVEHQAVPVNTDPSNPLVGNIHRIAESVIGETVVIGREHGASDARFLAEHGIEAIIYGPKGGGHHGSNEWISIASLLQHVEINLQVLKLLS